MKKIFNYRLSIWLALIFHIALSSFISCTNRNISFYDKVLNDFDTSSYFIALTVKASSYKGPAIVANNNLYAFLNKTRGFDKDKYKSYVEGILIHHRTLRIKDKDFLTWKIMKAKESEDVLRYANSGRDNFVDHYFNGVILNYGIKEADRNAIIDQLFYWEYPAKFDKATGDLVIG